MGERSAVRPKSGQSVCESDPGLRRPTPPGTAGRKPAARPLIDSRKIRNRASSEAGFPQPKIRRGAGWNPAVFAQREAVGQVVEPSKGQESALGTLDDSEITLLLDFFTTLDRWDREANGNLAM